jgi:hypothetical protein
VVVTVQRWASGWRGRFHTFCGNQKLEGWHARLRLSSALHFGNIFIKARELYECALHSEHDGFFFHRAVHVSDEGEYGENEKK